MYGEKPRVTYRKEAREEAEQAQLGLVTVDVDLRHLQGNGSHRMTLQAKGDKRRIHRLWRVAFGMWMGEPEWDREEGTYECER